MDPENGVKHKLKISWYDYILYAPMAIVQMIWEMRRR